MINPTNLKGLLLTLNFEKNGNQYSKKFADNEAYLSVDFDKAQLIYPEDQGLKVHERQTCNFSASENFVVFECVHRLLEKGYKPEHIELEPKWKLGHGASGGRADILIKDNQSNPLLLIECKTPGNEFNKAWKNTELHGDQLFSYAQQIPDTQFLCLYTSGCTDKGDLFYVSHIISHKDNPKVLEEGKNLKAFKDGGDFKARFAVWRDTYKKEFTTQGIFEQNIQPYQIGKDKYTLDDLNPIDAKDKEGKYHKFRTILRKHNVSAGQTHIKIFKNSTL
jgi:type I restriction enzyme M protein